MVHFWTLLFLYYFSLKDLKYVSINSLYFLCSLNQIKYDKDIWHAQKSADHVYAFLNTSLWLSQKLLSLIVCQKIRNKPLVSSYRWLPLSAFGALFVYSLAFFSAQVAQSDRSTHSFQSQWTEPLSIVTKLELLLFPVLPNLQEVVTVIFIAPLIITERIEFLNL